MWSATWQSLRPLMLPSIRLWHVNVRRLARIVALLLVVLFGTVAARSRIQPSGGASSSAAVTGRPNWSGPGTVDVTHGRQLYAAHCQACHGDRQGRGKIPDAPFHGPGGHTWSHSDRDLMSIILNGSDRPGGTPQRNYGAPENTPHMPAWKGRLSERDIRDILAYLKTWWTPEECEARREWFGAVEGGC